MPTPKVRFLEQKPYVAAHRDTVVSTPFLLAADAAMLQLVESLPDSTDPQVALAAFNRVIGARTYRRLLETIGDETPPAPPKRQSDNLNHER